MTVNCERAASDEPRKQLDPVRHTAKEANDTTHRQSAMLLLDI